MIAYIIKAVICSGLLLLVYRAFLGSENLYRFNRFYLLFSLVFSLAIPSVTVELTAIKIPGFNREIITKAVAAIADKPVQQQIADQKTGQPITGQYVPIVRRKPLDRNRLIVQPQIVEETIPAVAIHPVQQQIAQAPVHNYLPDILLLLYGAATLIMLLRFVRNSWKISRLVAKNTVVNYKGTKVVLINEKVTPHSFLKYVFINKDEYNSGTIEPEIICHEQTHVTQLHSVDIIIVELLQIVCWFNPFIHFYRKAIQLNHEFLADAAVIENYQDTPAYQYLLLAKVSQSGSLYLTSQFNYQVTKKRIIMMTKSTSTKIALYKQLALVPVLAGIILLFSHKVIAQNAPIVVKSSAKTVAAAAKQNVQKSNKKNKFNDNNFPAAKQDAPQSIVDEYTAILEKHRLPANKKFTLRMGPISDADKKQLLALYIQMSKEQQQQQYAFFVKPFPPLPKLSPTSQQLITWQDAVKYGVWIDGKRIKNTELSNYKPSDFDLFMFSRLMPNAVKLDKFHYQVDLMTPAYYAKCRKEILAQKYNMWFRMPNTQQTKPLKKA